MVIQLRWGALRVGPAASLPVAGAQRSASASAVTPPEARWQGASEASPSRRTQELVGLTSCGLMCETTPACLWARFSALRTLVMAVVAIPWFL